MLADGTAGDVRVLESSGTESLDAAAVAAVRRWKFAPATVGGDAVESVLLELQKTFDFFKATTSEDRIDRVVLSGGSARIPGLSDAMGERFDTRVEIFNPFQNMSYNPKDFDAEFLEEVGPACAIAVGLAMRKGGE